MNADEITYFEVTDYGTISYAPEDFYEPETREDFYDLSLEYDVATPARLISCAERCHPLEWLIEAHYDEYRGGPEYPDRLISMPKQPAQGWIEWVSGMDEEAFSSLREGIKEWLSETPFWDAEEDFIYMKTAQGAAKLFFEDEPSDVLDALGVDIVEGTHPGSNYRAAELHLPIEEANAIAEAKNLPYRFRESKA